jgi:hypothetical protein
MSGERGSQCEMPTISTERISARFTPSRSVIRNDRAHCSLVLAACGERQIFVHESKLLDSLAGAPLHLEAKFPE